MVVGKQTSAGYGIKAWLYQRVTAVVMIAVSIIFLALAIIAKNSINGDIATWQEFFQMTIVRVIAQITVLAVVVHAWVGMRDIWMDYVKCAMWRIVFHLFTVLWLVGSFIYSVKVIWG